MEHASTAATALLPRLEGDLERLRPLFFSPQEETRLQKARATLGELAANVPDEELEDHLTVFQSLLDGWLDSYERQAFGGLTLREVVRER